MFAEKNTLCRLLPLLWFTFRPRSLGQSPFCSSASISVPGAPASSLRTGSQDLALKPGSEICAPDSGAVALLATRQPPAPRSVRLLAPVSDGEARAASALAISADSPGPGVTRPNGALPDGSRPEVPSTGPPGSTTATATTATVRTAPPAADRTVPPAADRTVPPAADRTVPPARRIRLVTCTVVLISAASSRDSGPPGLPIPRYRPGQRYPRLPSGAAFSRLPSVSANSARSASARVAIVCIVSEQARRQVLPTLTACFPVSARARAPA